MVCVSSFLKEFKRIVLAPIRALFGHPVQKICFNKKSSYKLKLFLDIIKFVKEFWDPLEPPTNKMNKNKYFTYGVLGNIKE